MAKPPGASSTKTVARSNKLQSWTAGAMWAVRHPGSTLELLTPQAQVSRGSCARQPLWAASAPGEPGSRTTRVLA